MAALVWGAMQRAVLGQASMSRTVCVPLAAETMSFTREFAKQATEKRAKKEDKGDKVKKPKTAYIFYSLEARAKVISDNPSSSFGEISSTFPTDSRLKV